MGAWRKNKVDSSQINGGQEYTINSNPSLEQLNAITNNSFYAVDKADEALVKANSAFENNGTVVSVGGTPVANLSFTGDPQQQIGEINTKNINQDLEISGIHTAVANKANKDLSNVTYPQVVADGVARMGAGDRVVESFISSDGNTWYRKWASGWKECGLLGTTTKTSVETISLPIQFSTTTYVAVGMVTQTDSWATFRVGNKTQTTIDIAIRRDGDFHADHSYNLYCCGY